MQMLQTFTVELSTLGLIKRLQQVDILNHFTFTDMLSYYTEKYFDGNEFLVLKSFTYFADADLEPMPKMFIDVSWEDVKKRLELEFRSIML